MNKPYGIQGEIVNFPFKDLHKVFYDQDGIEIEIKDGTLIVGVDDETKLNQAKELAKLYLSAWSIRQNIKVNISFYHTWKPNATGGKDHSLERYDRVNLIERVQIQTVTHQATIQGVARIVTQEMHDSADPANDTTMVNKALKDTTLKNALVYFSEETVDSNKPLVGIYKALEEITRHLGKGSEGKGRTELAKLAGKTKDYVDDIMQTAQIDRHSAKWLIFKKVKRVLTDEECKQRAKMLLDKYADGI